MNESLEKIDFVSQNLLIDGSSSRSYLFISNAEGRIIVLDELFSIFTIDLKTGDFKNVIKYDWQTSPAPNACEPRVFSNYDNDSVIVYCVGYSVFSSNLFLVNLKTGLTKKLLNNTLPLERVSFIGPTKLDSCRYLTVIQDRYLEVVGYDRRPTQVMNINICNGEYKSFEIPSYNDATAARYDHFIQKYYVFHSTDHQINPSLPVSVYSLRDQKIETGPSLRSVYSANDVCVLSAKEKDAWWISNSELLLSYDCTGSIAGYAKFDWATKSWISVKF